MSELFTTVGRSDGTATATAPRAVTVARDVVLDVLGGMAGIAEWSAQWVAHTLDHFSHPTLIDAPELGPVIYHRIAPPVRPYHAIARVRRAANALDQRASAGVLRLLMGATAALTALATMATVAVGSAGSAAAVRGFHGPTSP